MAGLKALGLALLLLSPLACGDDEGGTIDASCGESTCAPNQYCCDAACGLCVEEGVACTEMCP